MSSLLPVFEEFLKNAPQDANYDSVRQSVVILMGSLAKHLDKNDPKVKPIVAKLITALSTPSQQVTTSFAAPLLSLPVLYTVQHPRLSPRLDNCTNNAAPQHISLARLSSCRSRSRWPAVYLL